MKKAVEGVSEASRCMETNRETDPFLLSYFAEDENKKYLCLFSSL
jgi:hypothetical protein